MTLVDGKLLFPRVPNVAGVYRFTCVDRTGHQSWIYIGEADPLPRRFQHYRTPGPRQQTNLRMNPTMCTALTDGAQIAVEITTQAHTLASNGAQTPLDLTWKAARVLVERAAEVSARLAGTPLLNR